MHSSTVYERRWRILVVLCSSLVLVGMDTLILNLALPEVQRSLGATGSELQWVVDAYTLAFGGLLMLGGGLGDRFGRKRTLIAGLLIVLVFSVGAAYAGSAEMLIAMRTGMGLGGALIMPATLSIIKDVFPREEHAKAISMWAASSAVGVPLGPVLGGLLLDRFWWGSVFLLAVPVVLLAVLAIVAMVPESRNPNPGPLDLVGVLLSVGGLSALVYGVIEGPRHGWGHPLTLSLLGAGIVLIVGFVAWERGTERPMLSPDLFRTTTVAGSAVAMFCVNFCMFGLLFVVTQYLQYVLGYGPLQAGLRLLPVLTAIIGAPLGAKLVERFGVRPVAASGLLVVAASMIVMTGADGSGESAVLVSLALFGFSTGFTVPVCANAILATAPPEQFGAASAVTDATLQVGGTLGIAVIGSTLATSYRDTLPPALDGVPPEAAAAAADSIGVADEVARQLGGDIGREVLERASSSFVTALSEATLIGGGVALAGLVAVVLLVPRDVGRNRPDEVSRTDADRVAP